MQITIDDRPFEFDESLLYLDFYIDIREQPRMIAISMKEMLEHASEGDGHKEQSLHDYLIYLSRWVRDAPRKRNYRLMKKSGVAISSKEYFFEKDEDGDKWIDALENTGKIAVKMLEHLGIDKRYPQDDTMPIALHIRAAWSEPKKKMEVQFGNAETADDFHHEFMDDERWKNFIARLDEGVLEIAGWKMVFKDTDSNTFMPESIIKFIELVEYFKKVDKSYREALKDGLIP